MMARGGRSLSLVAAMLLACVHTAAQQHCDADASLQSTPAERFEDHGDGTVTDRRLKLMWTRCSAGQAWTAGDCAGQAASYSLDSARMLVTDVNQRGTFFYDDWRLPQLREIATLIERQCSNPRVNLSVFPNTPAGTYWSATPRVGAGQSGQVYVLGFGDDGIESRSFDRPSHVRLVRRAQ
jgi:hypothetical protein